MAEDLGDDAELARGLAEATRRLWLVGPVVGWAAVGGDRPRYGITDYGRGVLDVPDVQQLEEEQLWYVYERAAAALPSADGSPEDHQRAWGRLRYVMDELTTRYPPAITAFPEVGRNDPCPCGSGRKYKRCHGDHEPGVQWQAWDTTTTPRPR